jgi:hypothetical protein
MWGKSSPLAAFAVRKEQLDEATADDVYLLGNEA